MFNATLDSVGTKLAETETAVTSAIRELTAISGLTWQTVAGKEFTQRSGELAEELRRMLLAIAATRDQLVSAMNDLAVLEEQIMQYQLAG